MLTLRYHQIMIHLGTIVWDLDYQQSQATSYALQLRHTAAQNNCMQMNKFSSTIQQQTDKKQKIPKRAFFNPSLLLGGEMLRNCFLFHREQFQMVPNDFLTKVYFFLFRSD